MSGIPYPPHRERVAIVTGGCHGAGPTVVRSLARAGFSVAVAYLDDQPEVDELVEHVNATGGAAVAIRADVEDELDLQRLLDETSAAFGDVGLLVHLAGAFGQGIDQGVPRVRPGS